MNDKNFDNDNTGYLRLVLGCMFSGKTSEIIKEYNKSRSIDINVLCINYLFDTRYSDDNLLHSHDKFHVECIRVDKLADVSKFADLKNYDEIMINEGQFFSDLKEYVIDWVDNLNKRVIVVGLDGDYKRNKFGQILDLIPYADDYCKTHGYCTLCRNKTKAIFTWKYSSKNTNDQIEIGGTDKYVPLCRKHYLLEKKQSSIL